MSGSSCENGNTLSMDILAGVSSSGHNTADLKTTIRSISGCSLSVSGESVQERVDVIGENAWSTDGDCHVTKMEQCLEGIDEDWSVMDDSTVTDLGRNCASDHSCSDSSSFSSGQSESDSVDGTSLCTSGHHETQKESNSKRLSWEHVSDSSSCDRNLDSPSSTSRDLWPLYEDMVSGSVQFNNDTDSPSIGDQNLPAYLISRVSVYSLTSAFSYLDQQGIH